ncbi:DUF7169 domain-containing protein [Micromonospora parva]|uniref:DUF7169 domain-containing protein n=1 Tax=Micromonospora parva TaxID=1464048 RepID=UPI003F4D63AC
MIDLLHQLEHHAGEIRQFVTVYDDAVTMPGRRRPGVDADGGRQASHGPSRPTEATAIDERRCDLQEELKTGAHWLAYAVAATAGVAASMDRALSRWEGEDVPPTSNGGLVDHHNGAAKH